MNPKHTEMIINAIKATSARYGIPQSWIHDPRNERRTGPARRARIECVGRLYHKGIPAIVLGHAFNVHENTVTKWARDLIIKRNGAR